MRERRELVVPDHDESWRRDLSQVVGGESRLRREHSEGFLCDDREVLVAIRRALRISIPDELWRAGARARRHRPLVVVVRPDENERADEVGTAEGDEERDDAAVAPADEMSGPSAEVVYRLDRLVGHFVVVEGRIGVRGASVPSTVDGEDAELLREHRLEWLEQQL